MTRDELIRALEDGDVGDRNHFATQLTTALIGDLPERREDDPDKWAEWHRTYIALARALHGSLDAALSLAGDRWLPVLLSAIASLVGWLAEPRDKNGHLMRRLTMNVCAAALRAQEATP